MCSVVPHPSHDTGLGKSALQFTAVGLVMGTVLGPCANSLMALGTERHTEVQEQYPRGPRKSALRADVLKNTNISLSPGEEKLEVKKALS